VEGTERWVVWSLWDRGGAGCGAGCDSRVSAFIARAPTWRPGDIPSVLSLLESHGLPLDGADDMGDAVVARLDSRGVGVPPV